MPMFTRPRVSIPLAIGLLACGGLLPSHAQNFPPDTPTAHVHAPPAQPAHTTPPQAEAPLSEEEAVRLVLADSPALQALRARAQAQAARWQADSRPGLLGFSIGRLREGDATEIDRHLSLGLLDLLLWPWRSAAAERQIAASDNALALAVLSTAQQARQSWVHAVAAQASLRQSEARRDASRWSAELARRLQHSGQFSAAQVAPYELAELADQAAFLQGQNESQQAREALVRLLGQQGEAARALRLPSALPPVPAHLPQTEPSTLMQARQQRLDLRLAEARWRASQGQATADWARSVVDIDVGYDRNRTSDGGTQQGPSLELRLLNLDFGAARRLALKADQQAALATLKQTAIDAESQLRLAWQQLINAHLLARQQADRLQPIRQRLLDERLKQHNGMLISPLDLLAEARAQQGAVQAALDAQRDYWLAQVQLTASIQGANLPASTTRNTTTDAASVPAGAH